MSDTNEPIAAILADFRKFALRAAEEDKTISPESVLLLADKVEAAINLREHNLCVMLATKRRDLDTVIRENEAIRDQRDNLLAAHEYDRRALVDAIAHDNAAREALDKAKCVLLVAARFATDDAFTDAEARENLRDVDWDGALAEIDASLAASAEEGGAP